MSKKKKSILKRIFLWFLLIVILAGSAACYIGYRMIYMPNTSADIKKSKIILIPTGSNFEDVMDILRQEKILTHEKSFTRLAEIKKYKDKVKPGKYRILAGISSNELINLLRAGMQEPVTLTFSNIRTKDQLVSRVSQKIEANSTELFALLTNDQYLSRLCRDEFNSDNILAMFIPNTYQFKWNTSAKQFLTRIQTEYEKFWTSERKQKANKLQLSRSQVSILASIVQSEQLRFPDERPIIAGLYLNRIRIGMPLQSDPTIIYAMGDFTINRVLDKDKKIDSPYNTYVHAGLPPGPIYIPEISSIDAVLNYEKNQYLYMCAKEDFSGRHNFSTTLSDHNRNAYKYRNALNKSNILR